MRFEGIHHITCITADAPGNVDFYVRVLGLRLVKKSVNQDDPTVYHLFYADEKGSAGSDLTFFEYPHARRGRAGAGMVHRIVFRVGLRRGARLLGRAARSGERPDAARRHRPPLRGPRRPGLRDRASSQTDDEPLIADHPQIPRELALQGFDGVRAYADPGAEPPLPRGDARVRAEGRQHLGGPRRETRLLVRVRHPARRSRIPGAGTVHHVAWASPPEEHEAWQKQVAAAGAHPTPVIDRFYFKSIYFREPSGVLFEIATIGPGFTVDEPLETLGERLSLPPDYEHLRDQGRAAADAAAESARASSALAPDTARGSSR